jgi:hypothetical protein
MRQSPAMETRELTDAELTHFGIRFEDEGLHPFDPNEEWWNESWFWDWFDDSGELAGHCRIGLHPAQKRAWVWLFLYHRGEWVAVEETRLPLGEIQLPRIAYDKWGLSFAYDATSPLRSGRFRFSGFGRVVSGPRIGAMLPVGAELDIDAIGPPHTTGRGNVAGHMSNVYDACRFEQPITAHGTLRIDEQTLPFRGRGERDHSWGPRNWNIEWTFLVANGATMRMQCAEVTIPNVTKLGVGYMQRDTTVSLSNVTLDFARHDDTVLKPFSGRFAVTAEDGSTFAARVEVISAAEIDIAHTFVPPRPSIYRRALIRVHPDDGSAPLLGWTELNYFRADSPSASGRGSG